MNDKFPQVDEMDKMLGVASDDKLKVLPEKHIEAIIEISRLNKRGVLSEPQLFRL